MTNPVADISFRIAKALGSDNPQDLEKINSILEISLEDLKKDNIFLSARVAWLEDAIDYNNFESIFLEYQKKFKLSFWSGDALWNFGLQHAKTENQKIEKYYS